LFFRNNQLLTSTYLEHDDLVGAEHVVGLREEGGGVAFATFIVLAVVDGADARIVTGSGSGCPIILLVSLIFFLS